MPYSSKSLLNEANPLCV